MRTTARPKIEGERGKEPQSKVFLALFCLNCKSVWKNRKEPEGEKRKFTWKATKNKSPSVEGWLSKTTTEKLCHLNRATNQIAVLFVHKHRLAPISHSQTETATWKTLAWLEILNNFDCINLRFCTFKQSAEVLYWHCLLVPSKFSRKVCMYTTQKNGPLAARQRRKMLTLCQC